MCMYWLNLRSFYWKKYKINRQVKLVGVPIIKVIILNSLINCGQ